MKMRMIGAVIGVPAALLIGGCSEDESWRTTAAEGACEDSVKAQLKDPDSAEFDGIDVVDNGDGTYSVTGRVNAENSFGGMTGFQDFECAARDDGDNVTGRATLLG